MNKRIIAITSICLLTSLILCGCKSAFYPWETSQEYATYVMSKIPNNNGISQQSEVFDIATHKVYANFSDCPKQGGFYWLTAYLVDFDIRDGVLALKDFYIEAEPPGNEDDNIELVYVHVCRTYYLTDFNSIIPIGRE